MGVNFHLLLGLLLLILGGCQTSTTQLVELPDSEDQLEQFISEQQALRDEAPSAPDPPFNLARAYFRKQDYDAAEASIREASRLDPLSADVAELRGAIAYRQRRYPEALRELGSAQRLDPERISVYLKLAATYEQTREYSLGIASLEEAIQREPRYTEALFQLSRLHLKRRDFESAKRAIASLLVLEPNHYEAQLLRVQIYLGEGSYYYAQTLAQELRNKHPWRIEITQALLHLQFLQQRWTDALTLLDQLEQQRALAPQEQVIQVLVLLQLKQYQAAEPLLSRMLETHPANVDVLMAHAVLALRLGDLQESLEWLRRTLEVDSGIVRAHFLKAVLLFRLGDSLQGDLTLQQALKLDPTYLPAQTMRLQRLLAQGQIREVGNALQTLHAEKPLQVEILHLKALWHEAQREYDQARDLLLQALQGSDSELLRFELARVYHLQGKPLLALPIAERLQAEHPESWEVMYLHALILARLGRTDEAKGRVQPFLEKPESLGYGHRLLGDLLRYEGQEAEAQNVLRSGLDRFSGNLHLLEALSASLAATQSWPELRSLLEIEFARQAPQGSLKLVLLDRLVTTYLRLGEQKLAQQALKRYHEASDPLVAAPSYLLEDAALFPVVLPALDTSWDPLNPSG